MKKQSLKERKLLYKATHKLLCPKCEGKTAKDLMLEHILEIPFLVRGKCFVCGHHGMLIEVPTVSSKNIKGEKK